MIVDIWMNVRIYERVNVCVYVKERVERERPSPMNDKYLIQRNER